MRLLLLAATVLAAGCAAPPPAPTPKPTGLAEVMERLAEKALRLALDEGLQSARDRATAHKLLAFITCTSDRLADCQTQFREARAADASFALSRSEAGHPVWGPVYKSLSQ